MIERDWTAYKKAHQATDCHNPCIVCELFLRAEAAEAALRDALTNRMPEYYGPPLFRPEDVPPSSPPTKESLFWTLGGHDDR